jgi:hypothetical protein
VGGGLPHRLVHPVVLRRRPDVVAIDGRAISDLDQDVAIPFAEAVRIAGIGAEAIRAMCRRGEVRARKTRAGHGGAWYDLRVVDLAERAWIARLNHNARIAPPAVWLDLLPPRCPRCGVVNDGLCGWCRLDEAGVPYWEWQR